MKKYDTVIFDLDGTLLNTLEDLADSVNYSLELYGFPCRTIEEVRSFVGNGVARLMELAVPDGGVLARNLQMRQARLIQLMQRGAQNRRREIQNLLKRRVFTDPFFELNKRRQDVDGLSERMGRMVLQNLRIERERFYKLLGKLDTLSPLATMERGRVV
jgi:FMN phosphatase YigB (HAD superfamily)